MNIYFTVSVDIMLTWPNPSLLCRNNKDFDFSLVLLGSACS